jgi:ribosomal protein L29
MKSAEEIKIYREMGKEKLALELVELQKKCANISLQIKAGKESNVSLLNKTKKNIARVLTLISESEME